MSNYKLLRISCWIVALAVGGAQAWAMRFTMNPDGISYLDIGDAYWRGDWQNAINAYWSPLYSWILGFFLKVLKPSTYWEYPTVHLVNFLIYVLALASFEFFVTIFISERRRCLAGSNGEDIGLSEPSWRLLGYSLFLSASILMIGLGLVAPDMCVAASVYAACGIVLRIRSGAGRGPSAALGAVLGVAYLSKAVMFPMAFVFLAVAFYRNTAKHCLRNAAVALLLLLIVAGPFILALSHSKQRLTFGDVGPIAYEVYVDGVDLFIPSGIQTEHPVRKTVEVPATYEFAKPVGGTYPLWFDPTYWHAGLKPYWYLKGQLRAVRLALLLYFWILSMFQLNILAPFLALLLIASRPRSCCRRMARRWALLVPAFAALGLYSVVYAESRYLGPFFILLWMAAFSGLRFPNSQGMRRFLAFAMSAIAATTVFFIGDFVVHEVVAGRIVGPVYWEGAEALAKLGLKPGDKLAVFAPEPFGEGGAFVARLDRAQIVIQSRDTAGEWPKDAVVTAHLIEILRQAGVRVALWYGDPPANSAIPWKRLGQTRHYAYFVSAGNESAVPHYSPI